MKNLQKGFITPLLLALVALLLIGGGAYVYTQNQQTKKGVICPAWGCGDHPIRPITGLTQATSTTQTSNSQTTVLNKICGQTGKFGASINKCVDFYSSYPGGGSVGGVTNIVSDAPTQIYDSKGTPIDFCGGLAAYTSDQSRIEANRKCSIYLKNCVQVVKFCSSETPVQ